MRPVLEAVAKSFLVSSGMDLAVSVALLALYMWFTTRAPLAAWAKARIRGR
jgi:hypothetical protein